MRVSELISKLKELSPEEDLQLLLYVREGYYQYLQEVEIKSNFESQFFNYFLPKGIKLNQRYVCLYGD